MRDAIRSPNLPNPMSRFGLLCGCSMIALVAAGLPALPAQAREVGVTAAVRPDVLGMPPGLEDRILAVGVDLFADEVIRTSKRGQTHLLFIDGSSLSVGPNAELKLDRFVYDPETKTGDLVITASKGLMRFVGGRLSKKKPVLIKTPTAVIGIRGGVAMMQVGDGQTTPPTSVTMLFGDEVSMESNGQRQSMTRPGFQLTEQPGGGVNPPRQVTQQELNQQLQNLEEPPVVEEDEDLGAIAPAGGGGVSDQDVADSQMDELGSSNDPNSVGGPSGGPPPNIPSGDEEGELIVASQQEMTETGGPVGGDNEPDPSQNPLGELADSNPAANSVNESATNTTAVPITAYASNVGGSVRYSLANSAGGRFGINPVTGVVFVANTALLDAETSQTHTITVRADNDDGSFRTSDFTITIGDDNTEHSISAVTDANATSNSLNHGSAAGTLANITGRATDADVTDGPNIGYSLSNTGGNRFQINNQTGVVSTSGLATLDFKANRRHTVEVMATSPDGSNNSSSFSIEVLYHGFQGRVKHSGNDVLLGALDGNTNHNVALTGVVLGFGDLSANVDLGEGGIGNIGIPFPDSAGTSGFFGPTNNWAFGVIEDGSDFQSRYVLNDNQTFVYYEIFDTLFSGRALLFAGDPTTTFPTSGVTGYNLTRDFVRNGQPLPFIDGAIFNSSGNHGEVYLTWGASSTAEQNAVGGGLVAINGAGTSQRSGMFTIAGSMPPDESGEFHISADLFGQGRQVTSDQPIFYNGGIASSDAGTGDDAPDFFGTGPDAFVLESADVNDTDSLVNSRGINKVTNGSSQSEAFYANSVATLKEEVSFGDNRTTQTLNGFASGIEMRTDGGATVLGTGQVFTENNSASNVIVQTDAAKDTVRAEFNLTDASERSVQYVFGSTTSHQGGAFIEDGRFFAVQNSAQVEDNTVNSTHGLMTKDVLRYSSTFLPSDVSLCTCEHLVWGFWGAQRQEEMGSDNLANTHLATWVAGSLASNAQVIASNQMARYSGHVIGNVATVGDSTNHYIAVGGIDLDFTFNPGNFTLDNVAITNFDGSSYTSSSSGGSTFTTNAYNSSTAGLTITNGSGRTAQLSGAFFAGQAAPAIPLATAGQGTITGPGYTARVTFAAQP